MFSKSSIGKIGSASWVAVALVACGENSVLVGSPDTDHLLPNWATEEESLQGGEGAMPRDLQPSEPAPAGFRVPAEYEPTMAVVMTWAGFSSILTPIAQQVAAAGAQVWVVAGPSALPNVPEAMYRRLDFDYDSVWSRDYGPMGIHEATQQLGIVDTTYRHHEYRRADDAIPCQVASAAGAECHPTSLIMDGGNFMTDGRGTLFMTKRTYVWNSHLSTEAVDDLLREAFNVTTIHALDYATSYGDWPADGTGHIDMFAKLLGDCKVLITETRDAPFAATLDAAATFFSGLNCRDDQYYEVIRIPGWYDYGTWYTYTNSLMVNQTVLVPSYESGDNEEARQIYQQALPGYNIVLIPSDSTISMGGSVHCVTKEIPALPPPPEQPTDY